MRTSPTLPRRRGQNGQSLVEFTLIIPVFLLILFGMIEFGFVFTHDLTVEYAVLQPRWHDLFEDQHREAAQWRLDQARLHGA